MVKNRVEFEVLNQIMQQLIFYIALTILHTFSLRRRLHKWTGNFLLHPTRSRISESHLGVSTEVWFRRIRVYLISSKHVLAWCPKSKRVLGYRPPSRRKVVKQTYLAILTDDIWCSTGRNGLRHYLSLSLFFYIVRSIIPLRVIFGPTRLINSLHFPFLLDQQHNSYTCCCTSADKD